MDHPKNHPIRVFLCHTSADKPKIRELYRYLRKRGIKPWFDEEDLIGGQDWQSEIPNALSNSDVILVCLSKNAVTKEGYVQKEITFALDKALEKSEGAIFIIPVRLEECIVPQRLNRYQWVDLYREDGHKRLMTSLNTRALQLASTTEQAPVPSNGIESKTIKKGTKTKFSTKQALPTDTMLGEALYDEFLKTKLASYIRVWEFQTLVNERTRDFIGRDFVFAEIDRLMADHNFPSGYILIRGEPGIGKTSLLSYLVKHRGYIHHFNISAQNIRTSRQFLANICAQLITHYHLDHTDLPNEATTDSSFLSQLLAEVTVKYPNKKIVVLVDALDETDDLGLPPSVNRLYLPAVLRDGVYFIITAREESDERLVVDRRHDIYLRDDDPNNLEDIRSYVHNFIGAHSQRMMARLLHWRIDEATFIDVVTTKSDGNFMYVRNVLNDIRDEKLGISDLNNVHNLPQGLRNYYKQHWRQMQEITGGEFETVYKHVIGILGVVREPVTIEQIAKWTKLDVRQVRKAIQQWREFLQEDLISGLPHYRIYHASFQDFLREEA